MGALVQHVREWRGALAMPRQGAEVVVSGPAASGFVWFLAAAVGVLYSVYGFSMGLHRCDFSLGPIQGAIPALVSAAKLPFLYLLGLAVCFSPLYVLNCLYGPRLNPGGTVRLLLLATSANAIAVVSYAPISLFFTLTTSRSGYAFLVAMHLFLFLIAGAISLTTIALIFRGTAVRSGTRLRPGFLAAWGVTYAAVMAQMSWALRPWIGSWSVTYTAIRPRSGTFLEGVVRLFGS